MSSTTSVRKPPPPPSWSSIPKKGELAIICSVRVVDFFQQAALQAYMFYQLSSFNPSAAESDVSFQVGVVQGVFTAAQIFTSIFWGRIADHPSWGRKRVILASLMGQGVSCIGFAFCRSFAAAVVWRLLGGAVNATVSGARTALSEKTEKKYHSRTFLLLPLAWNIANIFGPPIGGLLSDPVKYYPRLFGENSVFGGRNGVGWLQAFPYALPNLFCAMLLFADAGLVSMGLEETLKARLGKRDRGMELATTLRVRLSQMTFQRLGYTRVGQHEAPDSADSDDDNEGSSSTPMTAMSKKQIGLVSDSPRPSMPSKPPASTIPFHKAITRNVVLVLLGVAGLDFQLGAFTALWSIFLSTERRKSSDPRPKLPFTFTGGLGFSPSTVGLAMSILGVVGIICQLTLYPRVNARFGLVRSTSYSFFIFPIAYIIAPYLSLLTNLPSFFLWTCIVLVAFLAIFARTFSMPGIVLLTNNAAPAPELLGTIHGMGAATSSLFRTLGPIAAGNWYSAGLERGRVGEAWWLLALSAVVGCLPVLFVRDGK